MIKVPHEKDYFDFLERFTKGISEISPTTCFYVYGSIINPEECDYGRSDIDGGLILDSGIITQKQEIIKLSELLARSLGSKGLKIQFNLIDRDTSKEGRFLSYSTDYTNWLKKRAKILSGPNYISEMNGRNYKAQVLDKASFNFCGPNSVRNVLFYSLVYYHKSKDEFVERALKATEKVAKYPHHLLWLRGKGVIDSRVEAKRKLESVLEDIDLSKLDKINELLDNPKKFYPYLYNKENAIKILTEGLECMEVMIDSYLRHFPKVSERELRE